MSTRTKLNITSVEEPQAVGDKGARKLQFKAKTPDGVELVYFTFSARLFPEIKAGTEVEADVEVEVRGQYTNRKLVQLYHDGQAVGGQRGGGGYGNRPDNTASIESQVAAKIAADLVIAGKAPSMLEALLYTWCTARLGGTAETAQKAPNNPVQPIFPPTPPAPAPAAPKVAKNTVLQDMDRDISYIIEGMKNTNWRPAEFIEWFKGTIFTPDKPAKSVTDLLKMCSPEQLKAIRQAVDQRSK